MPHFLLDFEEKKDEDQALSSHEELQKACGFCYLLSAKDLAKGNRALGWYLCRWRCQLAGFHINRNSDICECKSSAVTRHKSLCNPVLAWETGQTWGTRKAPGNAVSDQRLILFHSIHLQADSGSRQEKKGEQRQRVLRHMTNGMTMTTVAIQMTLSC